MGEEDLEKVLQWIREHRFGKYRGKVVDNDDPTDRGRILVKVPSVLGGLEVWAMPCVPYAGDGVGFYALPEPDTGVWVEFEGGDMDYPVWTGCFWADSEIPDVPDAAVKIWKTASLTIRLDDDAGEMVLESTEGAKATLKDAVVLEAGGSKHTVGGDGVISEAGSTKAEVGTAAFKVNDGALEVV